MSRGGRSRTYSSSSAFNLTNSWSCVLAACPLQRARRPVGDALVRDELGEHVEPLERESHDLGGPAVVGAQPLWGEPDVLELDALGSCRAQLLGSLKKSNTLETGASMWMLWWYVIVSYGCRNSMILGLRSLVGSGPRLVPWAR